MRESNPRYQFGKLMLYHLTNPAYAKASAGQPANTSCNYPACPYVMFIGQARQYFLAIRNMSVTKAQRQARHVLYIVQCYHNSKQQY